MINEKFDTDLDDTMVCYQTSGSSFALPTSKTFREWLEKGNHEIIFLFQHEQFLFKHNYFKYL